MIGTHPKNILLKNSQIVDLFLKFFNCTLDKSENMINNVYTGWQFTRLPDALRVLSGTYLFGWVPLFNMIKINKIKNKDILVNYKVLANNSYVFREGDIFSIRKFGKYKFSGVVKMTKKDNYVICCFKYL